MNRIQVIDSHTAGEPTRVVVAGGPDLGTGSLAQRRLLFQEKFDLFRSAVINEPRGSDVLIGALLCEPVSAACVAGVIFFNNVGVLNMCGHGTIGLAVTLAHMGKIGPGQHKLETPVGLVGFTFDGRNRVTIDNVPSYRLAHKVTVDVPGIGPVVGDVAWGGNWFFLADIQGANSRYGLRLDLADVERLTDFTWRTRKALPEQGITGENGAEIDHIELFGPARSAGNHARNFVLCPGKAYDRSPCGTGTSAKLACLFADGKLRAGDIWRQESIIGSVFEGSVHVEQDKVIPHVAGSAHICAEATLILDDDDPFRFGIR